MKLTIDVTQRDIDNGLPDHVSSCPIALATLRVWQAEHGYEPMDVNVDGSVLAIDPRQLYADDALPPETALARGTDPRPLCFPLPAEAHEFIERFDSDRHVEPFSFTVHSPQRWRTDMKR